jgi:hypothetical protein
MKKALTIGLVGAALAATLSFVATSLKSESPVVSEAKADEPEPEPATIVLAQNTASVLNYERGPRIIIVPQAADRSRASIERDADQDDDDIAPRRSVAPPVRATPRWTPRTETRVEKPYGEPPRRVETPIKSRTETRSESRQEKRVVRHIDMSKPKAKAETEVAIPQPPIPQPPSPRRSVLSAPPPPAEGPSPIKPTPRFDSKLDSKPDSKFGARAESTQLAEPPQGVGETPPPAEITADQPPPGYTPPASAVSDDKY